jgi:hypothetical protein
MTDTHWDTIMRLLVEVEDGCKALLDAEMHDLTCRRIEVDEIWAFVGKKQRQLTPEDDRSKVGDQWTFVAIDPETKLIPVHRVGKRDLPTATAFMTDLSDRLANRVQLSSDALRLTWTPPDRLSEARSIIRAGDKNIRRRTGWGWPLQPSACRAVRKDGNLWQPR